MYESLEFIIACGGNSTRNYPHSKNGAHKSFLPFGDMRFIDFVLKEIVQAGGRHITIVCSNERVALLFREALRTDLETEDKLRANGRHVIADILKGTFLPPDTDLKFVIQSQPLGTAHVLGLAHRVSRGRHGVLIFPDDIIISKNPARSHLKRMIDAFLSQPKQILLSGREQEDVSNNAIVHNGRLIEKPHHPTNNIAGYSPVIFPKETLDFIERQTDELERTGIVPKLPGAKEWVYVDGINAFLDSAEGASYSVDMFLISPEDTLLDTGTLPLYEKAQLFALLNLSVFQKENRAFVQHLLQEKSDG